MYSNSTSIVNCTLMLIVQGIPQVKVQPVYTPAVFYGNLVRPIQFPEVLQTKLDSDITPTAHSKDRMDVYCSAICDSPVCNAGYVRKVLFNVIHLTAC